MRGLEVSILLTLLTSLVPFNVRAQAPVCESVLLRSDEYRWLEKDSPARQEWLHRQNGSSNRFFKNSSTFQVISEFSWNAFDQIKVVQSEELDSGSLIQLTRQGLGKPSSISLKNSKQNKVLFSNLNFAKNNSVNLVGFSVSPDRDLVVGITVKNGSINEYWARVYSISKGKFLSENMRMESKEISWLARDSFVFQSQVLKQQVVHEWNQENGESPRWDISSIERGGSKISVLVMLGKLVVADTKGNQLPFRLKNSFKNLLGDSGSELIFLTGDREGFGHIEAIDKKTGHSRPIATLDKRVVSSAMLSPVDNVVVVDHYFGSDHRLDFFHLNGQALGSFELPAGITAKFKGWSKPGQVARLELSSDVRDEYSVEWNLNRPDEKPRILANVLNDGVVQFESHVVEVVSADGVMIPVRLTYKSGLKKNGDNPVLLKVYGGFSSPGLIYGEGFSPMNKLFLDKGGILAAPAIRGGNEFGEAWHQAGQGPYKKIKSLEDTIAVAEWLTENKYSRPQKTIATGGSHGGFVVAAAALKAQNAFGLVIPIAGVHDMLGKGRMDKVAEELGWASEFGDVQYFKEAKALKSFSPVEMPLDKTATEFFLLTGQDDGRVNPSHTYKLAEALKAQQANGQMSSIKNAGHWVDSPRYQNVIGWRAQTLIWAKIFDYLNITF